LSQASASSAATSLSYAQCLVEAFHSDELRIQFERLTGHSLNAVLPTSALDVLIDQATGNDLSRSGPAQKYMQAFAAFVRECVWARLPPETRSPGGWVPDYPLLSGAGELLPC
jgi:hypothetical protein